MRGKGCSLRLRAGERGEAKAGAFAHVGCDGEKNRWQCFYPTDRPGIALTGFLKLNASPASNYFSERLRHSRCAAASIDLVAGHGFYGGHVSLR